MSKWISVEEKLPDAPAWVLVYADGAINCMFYNHQWEYPSEAARQSHNIIIQFITHWMPLPNRPIEMSKSSTG